MAKTTAEILSKVMKDNRKLMKTSQKHIDKMESDGFVETAEFDRWVQINKDAQTAFENARWTASL